MGNQKQNGVSTKNAPRLAGSNHLLASGEHTRHSGIYRIEHHGHKMDPIARELFIPRGTVLPHCRQCEAPLEFRLTDRIAYIAEDPDFR